MLKFDTFSFKASVTLTNWQLLYSQFDLPCEQK